MDICAFKRKEMQRTVLDMQIGERSVIGHIADSSLACRLLTIGMIPEMELTLVRYSPMLNALCIKLGETVVALRRNEAKAIVIL